MRKTVKYVNVEAKRSRCCAFLREGALCLSPAGGQLLLIRKDGDDDGRGREDGGAARRGRPPALRLGAAVGVPLLRRRRHEVPWPAWGGAEPERAEREGGRGAPRRPARHRRIRGRFATRAFLDFVYLHLLGSD